MRQYDDNDGDGDYDKLFFQFKMLHSAKRNVFLKDVIENFVKRIFCFSKKENPGKILFLNSGFIEK